MRVAERAGARAVARLRARVAERLHAGVPGVVVREDERGVVIEGRGLVRRWLTDARLRWVAGWLR